jgi:hypothetical protein
MLHGFIGRLVLVLALSFAGIFCHEARAGAQQELELDVAEADWGGASPADLKAVALSAAGEIWRHCGETRLPKMVLRWKAENPLTAYDRDEDDRLQIFVTMKGTFWAQLAFQFGHEFVHALAGHANPPRFIQRGHHTNLWFEESLCEAGSLYVLGAMSRTWKTNPPYANWKDYASALSDYREERMARPEARLPKGMDFSEWFAENLKDLRKTGTDRDANAIIAARLLPLFEKNPEGWEAVCWLNFKTHPEGQSLEEYLTRWHQQVPEKQRPFVANVAKVFGVTL